MPDSQARKMTTAQRRNIILEKLNAAGQINVGELSEQFGVSEVTIRNDLEQLEKKGQLIRVRGGAIRMQPVAMDFELSDKDKINQEQKRRIGRRAAQMIKEGDTIILDSGTTTMEIARNLSHFHNLTVITNALNIANELLKVKDINIIIPGGFLRKLSMSLVGVQAERGFRNFYCDKLFIGVDGLDFLHGLSTPNLEEAHLNQVMIDISKTVILVADSSKFYRRSFAHIAPLSVVHTLITDEGIQPEERAKLENLGIEVVIA